MLEKKTDSDQDYRYMRLEADAELERTSKIEAITHSVTVAGQSVKMIATRHIARLGRLVCLAPFTLPQATPGIRLCKVDDHQVFESYVAQSAPLIPSDARNERATTGG
ncbi:MAG: hypothetical protein L6R40_002248 [Gallowayella cf. fulva]|nr:MAG: hypothetical protein L6R40_002248 [Xanthomendoza cf. fulva]